MMDSSERMRLTKVIAPKAGSQSNKEQRKKNGTACRSQQSETDRVNKIQSRWSYLSPCLSFFDEYVSVHIHIY